MSDPRENPDFDLDEDLFDFAKVVSDVDDPEEASEEDLADVLASFREASAVDAEPAPKPESVADLVAEAMTPAPTPTPSAPEHAPKGEPPAAARPATAAKPTPSTAPVAAAPRPEPSVNLVPASPPARFSRGLVAIALSVTVANSILAIVLLRRPSHEEVRALDSSATTHTSTPPEHAPANVSNHESGARPEPRSAPTLPDPDAAARAHGHPALDEAREELARGDYAACRQHAYSLLSVIDRFEDPRREEIEAECQFLIAQALHLEALARLGRSE